MPQLMPLMWIFSVFMVIFILTQMVSLYGSHNYLSPVMSEMKMKNNKWCW